MHLTEFLTDLGPAVAYYPRLVKIYGAKETMLLCQFLWWRDKYNTEDGSFFKTREEIMEATGLSMHEQDGACKRLKQIGVLETFYHRLSHKKFYFLHLDKINELWQQNKPQTSVKPPCVKTIFRETGKPTLGKSPFPTSRNKKHPLREVKKPEIHNKRLKKENNKDKTTETQKSEIRHTLTLLGLPLDDSKAFFCILSLKNQYPDPDRWASNIKYTANQNPQNPIAYLTQSLKRDYGQSLRGDSQREEEGVTISLPPPGTEVLYNDQKYLIEEGYVIRNDKGHVVLASGGLYHGIATGDVTVKPLRKFVSSSKNEMIRK